MTIATPSEKFVDWFFQRFVLPPLLVCFLCVAVFGTYAICNWFLKPPPESVTSFSKYLDHEESAIRSLLTNGVYTVDEANKQKQAVEGARAYVREFLRTN